jgi:hypothetical protein
MTEEGLRMSQSNPSRTREDVTGWRWRMRPALALNLSERCHTIDTLYLEAHVISITYRFIMT